GRERGGDLKIAAMAEQVEMGRLVRLLAQRDTHPVGLEAESPRIALRVHPADAQFPIRELNGFMRAGRAIICAEGPPYEQHLETAEAQDRPCTLNHEKDACREVHRRDDADENGETAHRQRA